MMYSKKSRIRRAIVAVEMALVLPLLLLVLVGSIQYGAIFYLKNNMVSAAREGARRIAVLDGTAAQGQQTAVNYLAGWALPFTFTVHTPTSTTDTDVWVEIAVPCTSAAPMLTAFGLVPSGDLKARATMRKES
jgi:Flp pilus assembly protein TadG